MTIIRQRNGNCNVSIQRRNEAISLGTYPNHDTAKWVEQVFTLFADRLIKQKRFQGQTARLMRSCAEHLKFANDATVTNLEGRISNEVANPLQTDPHKAASELIAIAQKERSMPNAAQKPNRVLGKRRWLGLTTYNPNSNPQATPLNPNPKDT